PAALDVLSGQVPLAVVDLPSALQHIKAGKLIAYGVTSPQRLPMLPDVPTVAEAGLPGYDSTGWFGVVAPAGTPPAIIARLNAEITAALNDETIKTNMRNLGVEPAPGTVASFEAYIKAETDKWARVIKTANIKLE
ncbi:MAG: tripartite tricarboxylate transporter substrate binding protein, partial [Rhodoferax sp.]|nr:tripartite tricarboxylate transporter substrate binding protein [Rhodoferax sp.]MCB2030026.1 tripartite tricarboxylate transporter substrate binding protein [Rhodoferax sp.]